MVPFRLFLANIGVVYLSPISTFSFLADKHDFILWFDEAIQRLGVVADFAKDEAPVFVGVLLVVADLPSLHIITASLVAAGEWSDIE